VTPVDRHFANWLRRRPQPVILVANKAEGRAGEAGIYEAFGLGFGDPVPISAEHAEGLGELYDALTKYVPREAEEPEAAAAAAEPEGGDEEGEEEDNSVIQLAIVGRPNVGKSTLVNRLLGQERVLTGPEPGVTRDAIAVEWSWRGRPVRLIDTAGLRRHARVTDRLEKLSTADTLRAVRYAQVVVLVLDAEQMLEKQDLTIARMVVDEGRALVIAVNKWDLISDPAAALQVLRDRLETSLNQARGLPIVTLSALTGAGVERLMDAVLETYAVWNRRIATGQLNRWLAEMVERHPPPMIAGRPLRLRYMTQIKRRPPSFVLFTTRPAEMPEAYLRYLANGLREAFDLPGVPIRLTMRKGRNPYAE
jgi:GTP-binding protein